MTAAYDYIGRRHAQAHAEGIELDRVRADIAGMEAQLEKLTSNLAAARQYAGVLTTSILMAQQLVEDECKRNDWPTPEDPEVEPAPSPIERIARTSVDTGPERTVGFNAVQVADPVTGEGGAIVCRKDGVELVLENGVWLHAGHRMNTCPQAEETHPDPLLVDGVNRVADLGEGASDGKA
jgi:hypothetical protein